MEECLWNHQYAGKTYRFDAHQGWVALKDLEGVSASSLYQGRDQKH